MANLPLTGSQYWGAALNNNLRQVETKMQELETKLNNFTVAASYSGSGFTNGRYFLVNDKNSTNNGEEAPGILKVTDSSGLQFWGSFIFNRMDGGITTPITIVQEDKIIITFGDYRDTSSSTVPIKLLTYDQTTDSYTATALGKLNDTFTQDGYYPIYLSPGDNSDIVNSFTVGINQNPNFIFNENYILMGLFKKANNNFYVVKKPDNAFKTLYDTQKSNTQAFASVVHDKNDDSQGIFKIDENNDLIILFTKSIDYQLNGVGQGTTDDGSSSNYNYKIPTDHKRFDAIGRHIYKVKAAEANNGAAGFSEILSSLQDMTNVNPNNQPDIFPPSYIYGIYITAFGDIIVEETGNEKGISGDDPFLQWDLNFDSQFQIGTPVLLGAFYFKNSKWHCLQPSSNGISPTYMSNTSIENTSYVRWPDVTYLTYSDINKGVSDLKYYKFNVEGPKGKTTNQLKIDTTYTTEQIAGTDINVYPLLSLPTNFFQTTYLDQDSSRIVDKVAFGNLIVNRDNHKQDGTAILIDEENKLHSYTKFINSDTLADHEDKSSYMTILKDTYLHGKVLFDNTTESSVVDFNGRGIQKIGAIEGNGGTNGYFTINTGGTETKGFKFNHSKTTEPLELTTDATNGFKVIGSKIELNNNNTNILLEGNNLSITTNNGNLTLTGDTIILNSNNDIQINKSVLFTTSDRRKKENFVDINSTDCLEAVKKLQVKEYNYKDSNNRTLGLIAQDIEQLLPQYKDLLVRINKTKDYDDERSVAESKLIFILWEAVRELIKKIDKEDK